MSVLIILPLIIIGTVLYFYVGLRFARTTVQLIRSGDRKTWVAFLMMPMRCYRRDGERLSRLTDNDRTALTIIVVFNLVLWPLKVLWNIPGCVVFGPLIFARRFF